MMSRSCLKNIVKSSSTQRLLYSNRNVLLQSRKKASNTILPFSTLSIPVNEGLDKRRANRCYVITSELGKY